MPPEWCDCMEILLASAILLWGDLMTAEEYGQILDRLFLEEQPGFVEDILLELEWKQSDVKLSAAVIGNCCAEHMASFDCGAFGRFLFSRLERLYKSMDLHVFGKKTYCLWQNLPSWLQDKEPFYSLSYADDPLSWGDVEQTRRIYESIFEAAAEEFQGKINEP